MTRKYRDGAIATPYWYKHWSSETIGERHAVWLKVRLIQGSTPGMTRDMIEDHSTYWFAAVDFHGRSWITLTSGHSDHAGVYRQMEDLARRVEPRKWRLRGSLPFEFEDIVIAWPKPGYNRYKVAHEIQNASNASGVARELVKVIANVMRSGGDSKTVTEDAAVVAIVDKLQSMMRKEAIPAHTECRQRAQTGLSIAPAPEAESSLLPNGCRSDGI